MAKSQLLACAATIAAGALLSAHAYASPAEMLKQMDPAAPKYNAPECTEVREAANRPAGSGAPVVIYQGNINMPAGAAYAFGGLAIFMVIGAAVEEARREKIIAQIFIERCGEDAFVPYFTGRGQKGDDDAQAWLGRFYARKEDWPQAIHWYQAGADKGNSTAETGLGTIYANGSGVPQDRARAAALWEKASKDGYVEAQTKLGQMYVQEQNYARGVELLRDAGSHRGATAAFQLAELYEQGTGVARSDRAAFGWFSVASLNGHADGAARRSAVAARLKQDTIDELIGQVERCFYGRRCNF